MANYCKKHKRLLVFGRHTCEACRIADLESELDEVTHKCMRVSERNAKLESRVAELEDYNKNLCASNKQLRAEKLRLEKCIEELENEILFG